MMTSGRANVSLSTAAVLLLACAGEQTGMAVPTPPLRALPPGSLIVASDSFFPNDVVGGNQCEIIMVSMSRGAIVRVLDNGQPHSAVGGIPGGLVNPKMLEANGKVVVWAHSPPFWGVLDVDELAVRPLAPPLRGVAGWDESGVGPTIALPSGRFAVAPLGDRQLRSQPSPWMTAPMVHVIDSNGHQFAVLDTVLDRGGEFLSSEAAQVSLGGRADTIMMLSLLEGRLSAFAPNARGYELVWTRQLPQYLTTSPLKEEVVRLPWIQSGGQYVQFDAVFQVAAAAFGSDGKLYAIRNYATGRVGGRNPIHRERYRRVTEQGLEIYGSQGQLLGAYALPSQEASWIRVDTSGRIYLRHPSGGVLVTRDPTASRGVCPVLPPQINVSIADTMNVR